MKTDKYDRMRRLLGSHRTAINDLKRWNHIQQFDYAQNRRDAAVKMVTQMQNAILGIEAEIRAEAQRLFEAYDPNEIPTYEYEYVMPPLRKAA